jgi:hypothetical protein
VRQILEVLAEVRFGGAVCYFVQFSTIALPAPLLVLISTPGVSLLTKHDRLPDILLFS